jgi:hypothetical protein
VLAFVAAKLLPFSVLVVSRRMFLRRREALVVVPELLKVGLVLLGLLGVPLPMPTALLQALARGGGDVVVTGLVRPLVQHLRYRLHLLLVLLEAAVMPCLFHAAGVVGSWRAVGLRFGLSYRLSLAVVAALDAHARRSFVRHLQWQQRAVGWLGAEKKAQ